MRLPHTINENTHAVYRCSTAIKNLSLEQYRLIRSEDETWEDVLVPSLKILALRVIVENWSSNPLLEELPTCMDQNYLIENLPVDLPFELVIRKISAEHYWKRAAKNRWEFNDPNEHGGSWRTLYCERHFAEYLQNLKGSYYAAQKEECDGLIELVRDHCRVLRICSLQPSSKPNNIPMDEDDDPCMASDDEVHHIPLGTIFSMLPNLYEIRMNFAVIYMDDGFEWRDFEFSVADCVNLGKGFKSCPNLKKFALTKSNLDRPRAAAILQGLTSSCSIEELDFSHCKLSDEGAYAVGQFLSLQKKLSAIDLVDNDIGPDGAAGIALGLINAKSTSLRRLNLRLNPIRDQGVTAICSLMLRNDKLRELNLSGCNILEEGGIAIAEVFGSGEMKFDSLKIDISNNNLGPNAGAEFEKHLNTRSCLIGLDARMCNLGKNVECRIGEIVHSNLERKKHEWAKSQAGSEGHIVARMKSPAASTLSTLLDSVILEGSEIDEYGSLQELGAR